MTEVYRGPKFRTVFARRDPPRDARLPELVRWCRRFAQLGLVGPALGNLSFRTAGGFIITPAGTDPATITVDQFVAVEAVDAARGTLTAAGRREPSSESLLHAALYGARADVQAVFHAHHAGVLAAAARQGWPLTAREEPYGTAALAAAALAVLGSRWELVLRNHGFVALGTSLADAGRRVEEMLAAS